MFKEDSVNVSGDKDYQNFISQFDSFHFDKAVPVKQNKAELPFESQINPDDPEELLNKIKIVTETLADIYAEQGNYKEAFDAYNILLRAGSGNEQANRRKTI